MFYIYSASCHMWLSSDGWTSDFKEALSWGTETSVLDRLSREAVCTDGILYAVKMVGIG